MIRRKDHNIWLRKTSVLWFGLVDLRNSRTEVFVLTPETERTANVGQFFTHMGFNLETHLENVNDI